MFPSILTVLKRDSTRGYYHPDEGLLALGEHWEGVGSISMSNLAHREPESHYGFSKQTKRLQKPSMKEFFLSFCLGFRAGFRF